MPGPDYCGLRLPNAKIEKREKQESIGAGSNATETQLRIPLGAHVRYRTSSQRALRNPSAPPEPETYEAARKGTVTVTLVPPPGSLSNSNVPFSWSTRSRILITPSPPDFPIWLGAQPTSIVGH